MPTPYECLTSRIQDGEALVGIIGLGYVGLPLAHALHEGGLPVLGFDIDQSKIDSLRAGRNYLVHLGPEMTQTLAASERFDATTDFDRLAEVDVILVCLPTPLGRHREPDLSYIVNAGEQIGRTLRRGQLIVLESTTYPGTTREDFLRAILASRPESARDLECGRDFFVAFSPEREDPGRKSHSTRTIPKLVGGLDPDSTELAALLYEKGVEHVVRVSSADVAEAAKLLENIFRCVNIAMVNEMKVILAAMGIDVWEVIAAASTKPFGFMPFFPGPGLGGHCIPIDPFYLTWKAKEVGRPTKFIELAGEINTSMPDYVIEQTMLALNARGKSLRGSRVLVLGLAYKPDIDDTRESPSFEVIEKLRHLGAAVDYSDPHVPRTHPVRKHDLGMVSVELTEMSLAGYDAAVLVTDHKAFEYELIAKHAPLVVDTRNAFRAFASEMGERLVKA
ncbi:MAG: nucleotide sugar dehydrogenase [Phycisphaerales bacterium JB054]